MELKYLTYCRKSREDKDAQILSLDSQREELKQYAETNSLKVIATYEESKSAHKEGREVFDRLMTEIEEGRANALLCWKFDRLSRNPEDTTRIIKAFNGGLLQIISTPFETFKQGDNILLLYIHFGLADQYSQQLSSNVKRGIRTKLRLGQWPSRAPYGYKNYNRNSVKNIEPDSSSKYVEMIFKWYASGEYSLSQIKNKLNNDLKIPGKNGGKFSKSELQKILRNKAYYGIIERGGEMFDGTFQPIISKDLYDKANEILNSRSRLRGQKAQHPYKQMIICGECQSLFTAGTKHKFYKETNRHAFYTYYFCSKKKGYCSQKPVKETEIETQFIIKMSQYEFDYEEWKIAVDLLKLDIDRKNQFAHDLSVGYLTEIKKLRAKLNALIDLRAGNEITPEEYKTKRSEYLNEIKGYEGKIKNTQVNYTENFNRLENFAQIILQAQEILEGEDINRKRQLIKSISLNLSILDGNLKISFKKPFSFYFRTTFRQKPSTVSG